MANSRDEAGKVKVTPRPLVIKSKEVLKELIGICQKVTEDFQIWNNLNIEMTAERMNYNTLNLKNETMSLYHIKKTLTGEERKSSSTEEC